MYRERRKGLEYSAALHVLVLLLILFGLPSILDSEPPVEPTAITVELLPITGITTVKPNDAPLEPPKPDPKPEEPKKQEAPKKPSPPVKTSAAPPPPPKDAVPTPKKEERKPEKIEEKRPDKREDKADKNAKDDPLAAVLKAVKNTAQDKKPEKPDKSDTSAPKAISNKYDATLPMSLSEKDAIMGQLARCWIPPAGARDADKLIIVIDAEFNLDGTVLKAELSNESRVRASTDVFYRAAAESAQRAVRQCSPLKNLPEDKYATWKSMELHFDPREMLQ